MTKTETMNWTEINCLEDLPKKKTASYEQYDCLVSRKGCVSHLVWNCEHECWDDSDGDDYVCDPLDVDAYMIFPKAFVRDKSL